LAGIVFFFFLVFSLTSQFDLSFRLSWCRDFLNHYEKKRKDARDGRADHRKAISITEKYLKRKWLNTLQTEIEPAIPVFHRHWNARMKPYCSVKWIFN
jgi:hypothetical protein